MRTSSRTIQVRAMLVLVVELWVGAIIVVGWRVAVEKWK